jgi:hypothetical protein
MARVVPAGVAATPDIAGTLTLSATPAAGASTPAPAAVNSNPRTSTLVPGTAVKLTATAKAGYVFSHWSGQPVGATALGNVLSFTPTANHTAIIATFIDNPFAAIGGAANTFHGLLHPQSPTPTNNATVGFLSGTLTPGSGMFSGKVAIDGLSQMFSATFYGNGSSTFTVSGAKQPALAFGSGKSLTLTYSPAGIAATVTDGSDITTGIATRAIYSSTNKVGVAFLNASATKGFFTLGLPSKTQAPALPASSYPQGDGYASISLSDDGQVSLSGALADGTSITGSSALLAGNACPIFIQLVTPGAASSVKGGSFGGTLVFNTAPADSDVSASDLLWIRPSVTAVASPAGAALATNLYTAGWPDGIRVDAVGAHYNKALTVQNSLALGAPDLVNGNAKLHLTDGKLIAAVTRTNLNISGNVITKTAPADASYTLTATAATGAFSGSFTPDWIPLAAMKPAFKGILIQKGASKGGFGFFLSNIPGDADPESGGVTLGAP